MEKIKKLKIFLIISEMYLVVPFIFPLNYSSITKVVHSFMYISILSLISKSNIEEMHKVVTIATLHFPCYMVARSHMMNFKSGWQQGYIQNKCGEFEQIFLYSRTDNSVLKTYKDMLRTYFVRVISTQAKHAMLRSHARGIWKPYVAWRHKKPGQDRDQASNRPGINSEGHE